MRRVIIIIFCDEYWGRAVGADAIYVTDDTCVQQGYWSAVSEFVATVKDMPPAPPAKA